MELRMTVSLGTAIVAAIGAMTAIVKLFGYLGNPCNMWIP